MNKRNILIFAVVLAILLLLGAAAFLFTRPPVEDTPYTPVNSESTEDTDWGSTITVDGVRWRINHELETVLLLGIDSHEDVVSNEILGTGGRADTILLAVLDNGQKTIQLLEISRDTMLSVDVYDKDRKFLFAGEMQVNMQYAFGDSPARSCQLMRRKISELLYGIPIDSTASVTLDGINAVVDALGGVTVTLEEDWTDIDPAYTVGATVTLDGAQMERFLRYRDYSVLGTNDQRMRRQRWLIQQLLPKLTAGDSLEQVLSAAEPYLQSDISADTLQKLRTYSQAGSPIKLPGETRKGELHDEYYLDEATLQQLILDLFYVPAV